MPTLLVRLALAFHLVLPAAAAGFAEDAARALPPPRIELGGPGLGAMPLTRESLSALPLVEEDVAFMTSKGESRGRYKGVLLWGVLEQAGLTRSSEHNGELRRTLLVTGRDGYAIAFSLGELAPEFGNTAIMIAFDKDGAPLPPEEGLRLIVPGDRRGARSVRDVVRIEVR